MARLSHLGDAPVVIGICVLLIIMPQARKTVALPVYATVILASMIYITLKTIFSPEPQSLFQLLSGTNYGFPSGHAINNSSLYAMLLIQTFVYLKKLPLKILLALLYMSLTMLSGISRIVVGIHRSGDVLGGWLIGFIVAFLVFLIMCAIHYRRNSTR